MVSGTHWASGTLEDFAVGRKLELIFIFIPNECIYENVRIPKNHRRSEKEEQDETFFKNFIISIRNKYEGL